jgi:hypothetical protein
MQRWINIALLCYGVLCNADLARAAGADDRIEVGNEHVRIVLEWQGERWVETYLASDPGGWKPLLVAGHRLRPDPSWRRDGVTYDRGYGLAEVVPTPPRIQEVKLTAQDGRTAITKRIIVREGDPFVHVTLTAMVERRTSVTHLLAPYTAFPGDSVTFQGRRPDFIFTPQLRPDTQDVIGDHVFRSPALMMQRDSRFVALIPDPALMNTPRRVMRTGADVQMDGGATPLIAYGLLPWAKRAHVYYHHHDTLSVAVEDTALSCGYYLYVRAGAPDREGYREVVRFLWDRFGHANFTSSRGPQAEPFSAYIRKAWDEYVPLVALDTVYQDTPVTLLRQARLAWSNGMHRGADNDCWFNVWFNALRTAYGMALHGKVSGNAELLRRAQGVFNLALLAPQDSGIAPSIFYVDSSGGHWVADHAWGGIEKGRFLPMFHNAWTGIWLLKWAELFPERRADVLRFTGRFARFLKDHQAESGVIPSWYEPGSLTPAPEFRNENAESAGAAYFLAEYARQTGDATSLRAAERAMGYIFREIEPGHKWFDYETFFSCSRKPLGFFDSFTGQHPQNTLSMHQAAEACLSLFEITGEARYRQRGEAILDYLSLYQQVWSPRWLSCELFGGFGVQNTDGEWSDSRQGYFAVTYMRYYAATGRQEYFERGVAALRAMFSLFESPESPRTAENYAHSSYDKLAGVTGLHWGTGSSVVSIHLITAQYGDAFVDLSGKWGAGIDGCRIAGVQSTADSIRLTLTDAVSTPRTLRLVFGNVRSEPLMVVVNGKNLGQFTAAALQRGIHVDL